MWGTVGNIGALASIIGISATNWFSDPTKAWIALAMFILLLLFAGWRTYAVTTHFLKQHYPKGYLPLSAASKWTTSDGKNVSYELIRHIQIKRPVMTYFDHKFFWSGTKDPVVNSVLQTPSVLTGTDGETSKTCRLHFRTYKKFNEVEVLQILMEIDDSDEASSPHLAHRVESPIRLITFEVELLHADKKYFGKHAKLCRSSLEKGESAIVEHLKLIPFNSMTRSYSLQLPDPEPGFKYIFSWERPPVQTQYKPKSEKSWKQAA